MSGQWWLIAPDDRAFLSRGVNAVAPGVKDAALAGDASFEAGAMARLLAWGFNTAGAWSTAGLTDCGLYDTPILSFRKLVPEGTIKLGGALLPDVFNPRWVEACDRLAGSICAARRDSRQLIGYYTDDELGWAQPRAEALYAQANLESESAPRIERPSLLQICLSLEPAFPAYHAAWEFALAPYAGELSAMSRAWDVELPNKEALRQLTLADSPLLTAGYLADNERFSREFARRYFTTCAAAIRRHDANHLVLGCRFGGPPGDAVLAECSYPHVDVLSANDYHDNLCERIDGYASAAGMPVLLSEFSWVSEYFTRRRRPREPRGTTRVERMLAKGRQAFEQAFTHRALVGYAWHRWMDTEDDRPPFGQGLVHVDGREASEHTELLANLNTRSEAIRRRPVR